MTAKTNDNPPSDKHNNKKWLSRLIAGALVLAAAGFVVVVANIPKKPVAEGEVSDHPVNVKTMTIRTVNRLVDNFRLPGTVHPNKVVTVAAEITARIERVVAEEGKFIESGKPLVELNTDILQAEYDQASAQAQYDKREYNRILNLQKRGAATAAEVDNARTKAQASRAAMEVAGARLERASIEAPISGLIDKMPVEAGEYLSPGTPVAKIVQMNPVKIVMNVSQRDIGYLSPGRVEKIIVDGENPRTLTGKITLIGKIADETTHTTRVEITVPNPEGKLSSGQIVRAWLTRRIIPDAVMVPLETIIPTEEGYVAYTVENGKAVRHDDVELGIFRGTNVQVLGGLEPGQELITRGVRYVSPGQEVRIIPEDKGAK